MREYMPRGGRSMEQHDRDCSCQAEHPSISCYHSTVDCNTGFDIEADTTDGVHPNSGSGTKKVADCWYEPLVEAIKAASGATVGKAAQFAEESCDE